MLRGDQFKDESGYLAAFSEQGTSASHMSAAKSLDAIARMQDCDGEDSDATGAYTQAKHEGVETYVRLPKSRWPADRHGNYTNPVVRLILNLYGHSQAGSF